MGVNVETANATNTHTKVTRCRLYCGYMWNKKVCLQKFYSFFYFTCNPVWNGNKKVL